MKTKTLLLALVPVLFTGCIEYRGSGDGWTLGVLPKPPTNAVIAVTYTKVGIIVGQNPATQAPELTLGYQRGAYHRVPVSTNGPAASVSSGVTTKQDGLDTKIEEHFKVTR